MRIAYFNANLRVGQDGVTRVMYKIFEGARARHIDAIAFTSSLPHDCTQTIPTIGVPSVPIPLQKSYRLALPGYHAFARQLTAFRPDIIHINSPCTLGCAAAKYGRDFNIPVVGTYHTHFPSYPRYYGLKGLEHVAWSLSRCLYNTLDRTFVPTMPILRELDAHGIRNLQYLPNGVDLTLFHSGHRSMDWRERVGGRQRPVVLFVSRLVWEKDLRVLAEAYRILRSRHLDFEMVVVGDGHARKEFEQMMPGAHFLGYQTGRALAVCYASSDIFVFPSTTETFGLVTVEAMASGAVPVAANAGGASGIIEEGVSGLLAQPHSGPDLARKVEWLLDNDMRRWQMAERAVERAREFEWERILDQLFTSYETVIEQHASRRRSAA
jgi:phosphatidylinositol alpha 1,6-mannosyltransferase